MDSYLNRADIEIVFFLTYSYSVFFSGLVWQLMRAYTLAMLSRLSQGLNVNDSMIVEWVNKKVRRLLTFLRDSLSLEILGDYKGCGSFGI